MSMGLCYWDREVWVGGSKSLPPSKNKIWLLADFITSFSWIILIFSVVLNSNYSMQVNTLALLVAPCILDECLEGEIALCALLSQVVTIYYFVATHSYLWGVISDFKGHKPVLIISAMCMGLSTLLFGFSVNFAMAVVSRFLMGFTNGIQKCRKTYTPPPPPSLALPLSLPWVPALAP